MDHHCFFTLECAFDLFTEVCIPIDHMITPLIKGFVMKLFFWMLLHIGKISMDPFLDIDRISAIRDRLLDLGDIKYVGILFVA